MLALDIETIPLIASLSIPFDRSSASAPSNYKDPAKVEAYIDAAELSYTQSLTKAASLNPRLGRILCLSVQAGTVDESHAETLYAETETDERELLERFWLLASTPAPALPLVTWNGSFDLRFLIIRSLAHGIHPSCDTRDWFKRYSSYPHCDVKAFLLQDWASRVAGEGLDEWAAFFGVAGDQPGMGGDTVYEKFLAGDHASIRSYCEGDVLSTLAIYKRILPFL